MNNAFGGFLQAVTRHWWVLLSLVLAVSLSGIALIEQPARSPAQASDGAVPLSDRAAPQSVISVPAPNAVIPGGTTRTTVTGQASTAELLDLIKSVQVGIAPGVVADSTNAAVVWRNASLSDTNARATSFSYTWSLPVAVGAKYTLFSRAVAFGLGGTITETLPSPVQITLNTGVPTPTRTPQSSNQCKKVGSNCLSVPMLSNGQSTAPTPLPSTTPVPGLTPTPTPPPAAVRNGSFDTNVNEWIRTGSLGTGWIPQGATGPSPAVRLGDPNLDPCGLLPVMGYGQIAQQVTIPNTPGVRLSFTYRIITQDIGLSVDGLVIDTLDAYLVAGAAVPDGVISDADRVFRDGRPAGPVTVGCNEPYLLQPSAQNGQASIDISNRAGQTVWLVFQVWNRFDAFLNTYAEIDNITIN